MCAFLSIASAAFCQEFEVVSIRPSVAKPGNSSSNSDPLRFTASGQTLKRLIVRSYGVKEYQVRGPDWINAVRFDIAAKFSEPLPKDREQAAAMLRVMMQKMLTDRFKLAFHREQKVFPVYGLAVAKTGIKFKEAASCTSHGQSTHNTLYEGKCVSMEMLAATLSGERDLPEDLPVLDMTGLKAFYDLKLEWTPEQRNPAEGAPTGPPLITALHEQLGLKLESKKAPIDLIVVDSAEKAPTEN